MKSLRLIPLALMLTTTASSAQDPLARVEQEAAKVSPAMIEIRHHIHQNPELSNREEKTAALIADYLRKLGLQVRTGVARHGVVALLEGGRPGPVVAVRADIDALPVTEQPDLPFASKVRTTYLGQEVGVMHACGHDVHTAVQLGVATVLTAMKADLPGTVKFIFQPAEEGPPPGEAGGASLMVKEGVLENPRPQAIFGLHAFSEMAVGEIGYSEGPALSAADTWEVKIVGRQSHGARPELSIDPIVTAAEFIQALQTIRSRSFSGHEPGVVTIGTVHGGQRHNIIPADVTLTGTIRTFRPEMSVLAEARLRAILKGVTEAGGATGEVVRYERGAPATINHTELTRRVVPSLERAVGKQHVTRVPPAMGSEDFSFFANEVPGFFYRLGQVKPGTTSGDHHTPTFLADDGSIPVGIKAMSVLILDYLSRPR
ncbi:MAG: amidohydrolase [Acidobacteria bacterium]|nr:amidohydrolase [Acidobacteriota bacterium]MCA1583569.1 amidohydrolase [Acidobacteriota bacterium]